MIDLRHDRLRTAYAVAIGAERRVDDRAKHSTQ